MAAKTLTAIIILAISVLCFAAMAKSNLLLRFLLPLNRFFLSLFGQDVADEDRWAFWQRVNLFVLGLVCLALGLLLLLVPADQL